MKRIIVFILIAVNLLLLGNTAPTVAYSDGYEWEESVHDYANILTEDVNQYLGVKEIGEFYTAQLCVYTFRNDTDYHEVFNELKERGDRFIVLFIKVNENDSYVDAFVKYKRRRCEGMPDSEKLDEYFAYAIPYFISNRYTDGVNAFFSRVSDHIYDYNTATETEVRIQEQIKKRRAKNIHQAASSATIIISVSVSVIVAFILASLHTRRLKKQLKTVHESVDALYYLNHKKTRYNYVPKLEERDFWE